MVINISNQNFMKSNTSKNVAKTSIFILFLLVFSLQNIFSQDFVKIPEGMIVEGVPAIPFFIRSRFEKNIGWVGNSFVGWSAIDNSLIGKSSKLFFMRSLNEQPQLFETDIENLDSIIFQPKTGKSVLYLKDNKGDENDQIYKFDFDTKQSVQLTKPSEIKKVGSFDWSPNGEYVYLTTHKKVEDITEVYAINVQNLESKMLINFKGGTHYLMAANEKYLVLKDYLINNRTTGYFLDLKSLKMIPFTDGKTFIEQEKFSKINNTIWFLSKDDNFFALYNYDIDKKITKRISKANLNISEYSLSPNESLLAVKTNEYGSNSIHIFEMNGIEIVKELPSPKLELGVIGKVSWRNNEELGFDFQSTKIPTEIRSYNIKTNTMQTWAKGTASQELLNKVEDIKLIRWNSFDKREITGFLLKPVVNNPTTKIPVIIDIHGGPSVQFQPTFNTYNTYFAADLKFAVIFPNIRGSSGFGKEFEDSDNKEKRENALKDLQALIAWVKKQPDLDSNKIFIKGASYGGFMALALGLKEQDSIRAVIAEYPLTSIESDIFSSPESIRKLWETEYGFVSNKEVMSQLKSLSALESDITHWKVPVLLAIGKNDARIKNDNVRKLRDKFRQADIDVWFLEAENEGHGFANYSTFGFLKMAEIAFLKSNLFE